MVLTAEFRLVSDDGPLIAVVRAVPECTITVEHDEQTTSGPIVLVIRVVCRSFEVFEAALEDEANVTEFTLISDENSLRAYHVVWKRPPPEGIDELTFNKTLIERQWVTNEGYHLKQQFADRDELAAYRDSCREMGVEFYLDRLYETNAIDGTVPGVSAKQREALLAAYEAGYFTVPRQASLREVAASLGISRSALAERLHRGQSHVLEHYFYEELF
jgi:predicted DNA binding protein